MAELGMKTINELLGESFYIPSYQRGYRWNTQQVEDLLNDIWQFHKKKKEEREFYCLQPVVVQKKDDRWHLVDGQQRLTTIKIILSFLNTTFLKGDFENEYNKPLFSIDYQTRPEDFKNYLDNPSDDRKDENIDFNHINQAYTTIVNWFKTKDRSDKDNFLKILLGKLYSDHQVKIIWYDISGEDSNDNYEIDVFTRLNIGKIPLTNAELIKALFLSKVKNISSNAPAHKQNQIASEWDMIEKELRNDKFWYFLWDEEKIYDTRIEYLFDLITKKSANEDPFFTFHEFNKRINDNKIDVVWLEVKNLFQKLHDWYHNHTLYHYIGFLIVSGKSIADLLEKSENKKKSEFNVILKNMIKEYLKDINLSTYEYEDKKTKELILLFNIELIIQGGAETQRFPFDWYKKDNSDIEHISSQTPQEIRSTKDQKKWLEMMFNYFTGIEFSMNNIHSPEILKNIDEQEKSLVTKINEILNQASIDQDTFKSLFASINQYFANKESANNVKAPNRLSNLALLDSNTNRSYKNAPFIVKRKTLLSRDMSGYFIPPGTKIVFLKGFSNKSSELLTWTEKDANDYQYIIEKTLGEYFDTNETKEATNE